jgi:hypothetical protein
VYEHFRGTHCLYFLPRKGTVCCAGMLVPIYQITTWYCNPKDSKQFESKYHHVHVTEILSYTHINIYIYIYIYVHKKRPHSTCNNGDVDLSIGIIPTV